jgi:hypothetical protein
MSRISARKRRTLRARKGSFLLEQYPFWNDLVEICVGLPEPETEEQRYFTEQLMLCLDGARQHWQRVAADMDEAAIELKLIENGGK